jgi:hypothetical protein
MYSLRLRSVSRWPMCRRDAGNGDARRGQQESLHRAIRFSPSVREGNATSGIQEREQQAQGDVANYHYADNLKITYRHALRCVVSMIPHYYDGARIVRIVGEDEQSEVVPINQQFEKKIPRPAGSIRSCTT